MEFKQQNLQKIYKELISDKENLPLSELKNKYISKKGLINDAFNKITSIKPKERAEYGQEANQLKKIFSDILNNLSEKSITYSTKERIDVTAPFDINCSEQEKPIFFDTKGTQHPLTNELETFTEIFKGMGFNILESRQIDDDFHMFESLNFPVGHPARDMYDTFWTEDGFVLPAHTSTMQNRAMKMFGPPPVAVILPGRCFRNEATDASHEFTFHQIEGIYVDENVSLGNMVATIKEFLQQYLETTLDVRIQPSFFPFTEPDCEFVIGCPFCNKAGCSTCGHSGWIELMGCGMIHPNVLKQAGIDPSRYSGFAWGFGVDRLTMIKRGINDIRYLRDSNLNFLQQF